MNPTKHTRICGHNIELTLSKIQPQNAGYYIDDELLNYKVMDDVVRQIKIGKREGNFQARSRIYTEKDGQSRPVKMEGSWHIRFDYGMLYRIFRWWYNCNFDPKIIHRLFQEVFGDRASDHYLKEYNGKHKGNLFDFMGYIGTDTKSGYAFFDRVSQEMEAYEAKYNLDTDF